MAPASWLERVRPSPRWHEAVFWALDLETTGLEPRRDHIIAVGAVPIRGGVIRYGERYHTLVRPEPLTALPTDGLRLHHILPGELAGAPRLRDVVPELDRRLREGVLLVHFAALDLAFLRRAYHAAGRPWPRPPLVDTVDLVLALHGRRHRFRPHPPAARTSLTESREDMGLPPHDAHDALGDALATAELFLALRSMLDLDTLRQLRRRRRA
jgi:DNA polymerase-3 subunit epsilon